MSEEQEVFVVEEVGGGCCSSNKQIYYVKLNKLLLRLQRRVLDNLVEEYRDQIKKKDWGNSQCPFRAQIGKICIYFKQFLHFSKFKKFYRKKRGVVLLQQAAISWVQIMRTEISKKLIQLTGKYIKENKLAQSQAGGVQSQRAELKDVNGRIFLEQEMIPKEEDLRIEPEQFQLSEEQRQAEMKKLLCLKKQFEKILEKKKNDKLQHELIKFQLSTLRIGKKTCPAKNMLIRAIVQSEDLVLGSYQIFLQKECTSGELVYGSLRKDMFLDVHVQTIISFECVWKEEGDQKLLMKGRVLPFQWRSPPPNGMQLSIYMRQNDDIEKMTADIDARVNVLTLFILPEQLRAMIISEDLLDQLFRRPILLPPVRLDYHMLGKMFLNQQVKITRPAMLQQMRKQVQFKKLKEFRENALGQQISRKVFSQYEDLVQLLEKAPIEAKPVFDTGIPPQIRLKLWSKLLKVEQIKHQIRQRMNIDKDLEQLLKGRYTKISSSLKTQLDAYFHQYASALKVKRHQQSLQQIIHMIVAVAELDSSFKVVPHPSIIAVADNVLVSLYYCSKSWDEQLVFQTFWLSLALLKNVFKYLIQQDRHVLLNHVDEVIKILPVSMSKHLRSIAVNSQQLVSKLVVSCFTGCCPLTWNYLIDILIFYFHLGRTAVPNVVQALFKLTLYLSGPGAKEIFENSMEVVCRLCNSRQIINVVLQSLGEWQIAASSRQPYKEAEELQTFSNSIKECSQTILKDFFNKKSKQFKIKRIITSIVNEACSDPALSLCLLLQQEVELPLGTLVKLQQDCRPLALIARLGKQVFQVTINLQQCSCKDNHYELITLYLKQQFRPVYITLRIDLIPIASQDDRSKLKLQAFDWLKGQLHSSKVQHLFDKFRQENQLECLVRVSVSLGTPLIVRLTFLFHLLAQFNQIDARLTNQVIDILYRLTYKSINHTAGIQSSVLVVARTYKGDLLLNEVALKSLDNHLFRPWQLKLPDIKSVRVETDFEHFQVWTPKQQTPLFIKLTQQKLSLDNFCEIIMSHQILRIVLAPTDQCYAADCQLVIDKQASKQFTLNLIQAQLDFDNTVELPRKVIVKSLPMKSIVVTSRPVAKMRKCWIWGTSGLLKAWSSEGQIWLRGQPVTVPRDQLLFQ